MSNTEHSFKKVLKLINSKNIQILCVLYVAFWAVSPPLQFGIQYRILGVVSVLLWCLVELRRPKSIFTHPTLPFLAVVFHIVYVSIFIEYLFPDTTSNTFWIQYYIYFFFIIFYEAHKKRDISELKWVFWIILITFPIWLFQTYNALESFSSIARKLTRSSDITKEYMNKGVGGFGMVYSTIILIPILVKMILEQPILFRFSFRKGILFKKRIEWKQIVILINIVLGLLVVVKAAYSTALLLLTLSLIILLAFKERQNIRNAIIVLFIGFMVFIIPKLFITYKTQVLETALVINPNYHKKLRDIYLVAEIGSSAGAATVNDRQERYERSINLFVSSPLFGVLRRDDVGKHSVILDHFAQFGLFIGMLIIYIVVFLPIQFIQRKEYSFLALSMLSLAFLSPFLNNLVGAAGLMLYIMYPIGVKIMTDNKKI